MPLTPQDVHNKVFGPTRFRRGYDEAEVDAFLDEVETELTRLHREIESLRSQLGGGVQAVTGTSADEPSTMQPVGDDEAMMGSTPSSATAASAQAAAQSVGGGGDGGNVEQQVARTLVLAQRAADEAVRDAEQQAEQLRRSAEAEAERVRTEAAQQAERERREMERVRSEAEDEVEQLRAFEREYRTRLRAYLEHQLRELEAPHNQVTGDEGDAPAGAPHGGQAERPVGNGHEVRGQLPSDLPTTDLPDDDPAAVPPVAPPSEDPAVPPSVAVSDYSAPSGVGDPSLGDDVRHERRDLHDGF